jgi:hypothetical protein
MIKGIPSQPLSKPAIEANINYYEALVKTAHDTWEQNLQSLQYWLDQLEKADENSSSISSN